MLIDLERGRRSDDVEALLGEEARAVSVITVGEPIGAHDLWIAATALAHDFGVATGNASRFDWIPGLRVVATAA